MAASSFRRSSRIDGLLAEADRALRVLAGAAVGSRPNPASARPSNLASAPVAAESVHASPHSTGEPALPAALPADEPALTAAEARHAAGLMRVNHVGEVCAQALYRGQALMSADPAMKTLFAKAAAEEMDHLAWVGDRLRELRARPSLLNPLWYAGSFALGVAAGKAGDRLNLGFMAETEKQVERHLVGHLQTLPENDRRSRAIVVQMCEDERQHRLTAEKEGARPLPHLVRTAMRLASRLMTVTAYRL